MGDYGLALDRAIRVWAGSCGATWLSGEIAKLRPFELLSDGSAIPVFAFRPAQPRAQAPAFAH